MKQKLTKQVVLCVQIIIVCIKYYINWVNKCKLKCIIEC